jgi:microcystin-dependent protein
LKTEALVMKKLLSVLFAIGLNGALCLIPGVARAQATDPFLGEIATFGFSFCPTGWAPLNGQLLAIAQNTALFSLLGTTYGGDGKTTFALPIAKPVFTATGAPFTLCISLVGVYPSRS